MRKVADGALRHESALDELVPDRQAGLRPSKLAVTREKKARVLRGNIRKLSQSNYVAVAKMIENLDKILEEAMQLQQETGSEFLAAVTEPAEGMKQALIQAFEQISQIDTVNQAFDQADGAGPMTNGQPVMPTQGQPVMPTAGRKKAQTEIPELEDDSEWKEGFGEGHRDSMMGRGYQGKPTADLIQGASGGVEVSNYDFGYWHGYVGAETAYGPKDAKKKRAETNEWLRGELEALSKQTGLSSEDLLNRYKEAAENYQSGYGGSDAWEDFKQEMLTNAQMGLPWDMEASKKTAQPLDIGQPLQPAKTPEDAKEDYWGFIEKGFTPDEAFSTVLNDNPDLNRDDLRDAIQSVIGSKKTAAFKVWVTGVGENTWVSNQKDYESEGEAEQAAGDLASRWFGMDQWTVQPTGTDPNNLDESQIQKGLSR